MSGMLSRRTFLTTTGGAATWTALRGAAAPAADTPPPNIVFLISDDQGWGDYGFMGHPHIETPRLDALAEQSVTFTNGYVAAPLCCPSLASMITGLHPHQHKITCNDPPFVGDGRGWPPKRRQLRGEMMAYMETSPTLPRLLREKGYASLQTGKWWAGHYSSGGFTHGMTHGDMDRGGRHGDVGLTIGRETMEPVETFVAEAAGTGTPFFLWYAPMMPHLPHTPPERLLEKYRQTTPSIHVARYRAMCEWFDETCGQVLDTLDRAGVADNTVVFYICDNGWIQRQNSKLPAPRSKTTSYQGGVRTPVLVRWPGRIVPRRDDRTPVSAVDLAPTALRLCGLLPTPNMQGVNLLDREAVDARDAVCGATYSHNAVDIHEPIENLRERWIVTDDRWKLILPYRLNKPSAVVQLYDLKADPTEKENLAEKNRGRIRRLQEKLNDWWGVDDPLPLRFPEPPPEEIAFDFNYETDGWSPARQLRNLGVTETCLEVESVGDDPILVISPCRIDPSGIERVRVRMAVSAGATAEFHWGTETEGRIDPGTELTVPIQADGAFHEIVFEVGKHPKWTGGPILRLRLDPTDAPAQIRIDWIRGE